MQPTSPDAGPDPIVAEAATGYAFDGPALELGALMLESRVTSPASRHPVRRVPG